jgi:hypothetical protein
VPQPWTPTTRPPLLGKRADAFPTPPTAVFGLGNSKQNTTRACARERNQTILSPPAWPLFKRSSVAAFERSVTACRSRSEHRQWSACRSRRRAGRESVGDGTPLHPLGTRLSLPVRAQRHRRVVAPDGMLLDVCERVTEMRQITGESCHAGQEVLERCSFPPTSPAIVSHRLSGCVPSFPGLSEPPVVRATDHQPAHDRRSRWSTLRF